MKADKLLLKIGKTTWRAYSVSSLFLLTQIGDSVGDLINLY